MSQPPYDAVIFDFDGTLADTADQIIQTAKQVLSQHGLANSEYGRLKELIGPPFPQAFSLVFGYSAEEAAQITKEYRAIYGNLGVEAWPLFEGIADLLRALWKRGVLLGVASSKRDGLLHCALKENKVDELFSCVRGKMNDCEEAKALTLSYVMKDLQKKLPASSSASASTPASVRMVMVGDRFYDIDAARSCGIESIGVYYGKTAHAREHEDAGATHIVQTVAELRGLLLP